MQLTPTPPSDSREEVASGSPDALFSSPPASSSARAFASVTDMPGSEPTPIPDERMGRRDLRRSMTASRGSDWAPTPDLPIWRQERQRRADAMHASMFGKASGRVAHRQRMSESRREEDYKHLRSHGEAHQLQHRELPPYRGRRGVNLRSSDGMPYVSGVAPTLTDDTQSSGSAAESAHSRGSDHSSLRVSMNSSVD